MPFAGYQDFAACVAANQGKSDPAAYCGAIKHRTEDMGKTLADVLKDGWDESKHPRHPAGSASGGEFRVVDLQTGAQARSPEKTRAKAERAAAVLNAQAGMDRYGVISPITSRHPVATAVDRLMTGRPDPGSMTPAEINRELDKIGELNNKLNMGLIEQGRGYEKPSERAYAPDALAQAERDLSRRSRELIGEIEARMGPGYHRMSPGFKARRPKEPRRGGGSSGLGGLLGRLATFGAMGGLMGKSAEAGMNLADVLAKDYDESKHPRHPSGTSQGGEFAPKGGGKSNIWAITRGEYHARKPSNWSEAPKLRDDIEASLRGELGRLPVARLSASPMDEQFDDRGPHPEFIGERAGQWYHIDTQGYKYGRYVTRLSGDPRIGTDPISPGQHMVNEQVRLHEHRRASRAAAPKRQGVAPVFYGTGHNEGWYFQRGEESVGPFKTKREARTRARLKKAATLADVLKGEFNEEDHPRHPGGRAEGGEFAPKGGSSGGGDKKDEDTPEGKQRFDMYVRHDPEVQRGMARSSGGEERRGKINVAASRLISATKATQMKGVATGDRLAGDDIKRHAIRARQAADSGNWSNSNGVGSNIKAAYKLAGQLKDPKLRTSMQDEIMLFNQTVKQARGR